MLSFLVLDNNMVWTSHEPLVVFPGDEVVGSRSKTSDQGDLVLSGEGTSAVLPEGV